MRIAIDARKIADFGIGTYIRGLLSGLSELPADDEYFLFAPESAAGAIPADPRFRLVPDSSPHYSLRELVTIGRRIRGVDPELFHAPHYVTPFTRVPTVVTIHDLIHLHQPHIRPLARLYARVMIGRAVGNSRRILTVSETVSAELAREFPASRMKTVVTPNGVDALFRETPADRETLLAALGLRAGDYLLFVGNDKPHKNLEQLLAAHRLLETAPPLVLAGGAFASLRATPNVRITGFLPQRTLAALVSGARLLVQPSLEEGFGLPAAEAMAAGVAVITSTAPSLVEVTGGAALHVDPHAVGALADALRRLLGDDALRATMIARGRERVLQFTWRRCAERTRDAYRDALGAR